VGEVVSIDGVYGKVTERTLLATRLMTMGNEQVTIPNSKILTTAVTNYSAHGQGQDVAMIVTATIGYDVDWRTVHKLLIEGARRTKQIITDQLPKSWNRHLGTIPWNTIFALGPTPARASSTPTLNCDAIYSTPLLKPASRS
jgi:small-conductance mechanosensitive channel